MALALALALASLCVGTDPRRLAETEVKRARSPSTASSALPMDAPPPGEPLPNHVRQVPMTIRVPDVESDHEHEHWREVRREARCVIETQPAKPVPEVP